MQDSLSPSSAYRQAWSRAAGFPANKEDVYPGHAAAQQFDRHHGARVLEYGCGGGSDTMSYLRRGCQVTFVDIVPANVCATADRILRAGLWSEKSVGRPLHQSNAIPLPDDSVDVVSAHGVIHHIKEPLPVLREFLRVLRPGGDLYVMLYTETLWERFVANHKRRPDVALVEAFAEFTDGPGAPYARPYTEPQGWDLLRVAGFLSRPPVVEYNRGDFRTFHAASPP